MFNSPELEKVARNFCARMGIEPEEVRRHGGRKMANLQLATMQAREFIAMSLAFKEVTSDLPEVPTRSGIVTQN